jgi:hypothetical protein
MYNIEIYLQATEDLKNNKISFSEFEKIRSQFSQDKQAEPSKEALPRLFDSLIKTVKQYMHLNNLETALRVLLSAYIGNQIEGFPIWLLIIGASSGGKTELLNLLYGQSGVMFISSLTAQTFASGYKGKKSASLLEQLPKYRVAVLVLKDFGSILELQKDKRAEIVAQLREIADGEYAKRFGTGDTVEWSGKLALMCASTTAYEMYSSVIQVLGERFLIFKLLPSATDQKLIARKALEADQKELQKELARDIVKKIFSIVDYGQKVQIPSEINEALISLSVFVATLRSAVIRNSYTHEILYVPEPEAPARIVQQFVQLLRGLALLRGDTAVTAGDYEIVLEIGLDCIPSQRMGAIEYLSEHGSVNSTELGEILGVNEQVALRTLQDLRALGVLEVSQTKKYWLLGSQYQELLQNIFITGSNEKVTTENQHPIYQVPDFKEEMGNSDLKKGDL